jgi:hypothetical protein
MSAALLATADGFEAFSCRPISCSTELQLGVALSRLFVRAAIRSLSARQVLDRFLLGDGPLFLTLPSWRGSDSSGGASFGRPTLLVRASESEFYTNSKRIKNESEKHDIHLKRGIIQQ